VGIAVTFEGTVWGWGYNFQDVFGLPGGATNTVRSPVQLPIPCNVKRAMVGMSGDQVPNQSVLEAQMVRGCFPFLPHTTPFPAFGLRLCVRRHHALSPSALLKPQR
jgi:hypothetical protein